MAELVQDKTFIYSRLKTPFTWYQGSVAQATEANLSLVNGTFATNLDQWAPTAFWSWNAATGGVARWSSVMANFGTLTQQYIETPKLTFAVINVKAISAGFVVLKIVNSVTGATYVTSNITSTGIYTLTGVGNKIVILANGAAVIDVDDVEAIVLDDAPQLNMNRAYCQDECPYKLHTGATTFLNFALVRKTSADPLKYIIFVHEDGTKIFFTAAQIASQLGITDPTFQDRAGQIWDYFIYHGQDHTRYFKCGYWRGYATDAVDNVWYSEPFYVGEYGAEEIPGNNILVNGNFTTDLSSWFITGPPAWVPAGGAAYGSGIGVCEQALPFSASGISKKVRFKIKVNSLTSPMAMLINTVVGGVTGAFKVITEPGIHTIEGYGDQVYFSIAAVSEAIVEWAQCYILNVNPNLCHTELKWKNSCDLFNIPYSQDFTNRLYLESPALTIAPGWKEETEVVKDGAGRETNISFRKMKEYLLETAEIPEFVYDALGLLNSHNDMKISLPVYSGQKDIIIAQADLKNEWLAGECYANASLRLIIEDYFDTSCCDSLNYQVTCKETCFTVKSLCLDPGLECPCTTAAGNFYLAAGIHEIFGCFGPDLVLNVITAGMVPIPGRPSPYDDIEDMFSGCGGGEILILNEDNSFWYVWYTTISYPAIPLSLPINDWKTIYEIISVTPGDAGCVTIVGLIPFWAFGIIEISTNAGVDWTEATGTLTQAQLAAGYEICDLESGDVLFRIHTKNLNCEYGRGASVEASIPAGRELRDDGGDEMRDDSGDEMRDV